MSKPTAKRPTPKKQERTDANTCAGCGLPITGSYGEGFLCAHRWHDEPECERAHDEACSEY